MPIRRLPPLLVDQIAAGEVVERPASVVKELFENAVDAGASRVRVDIEGGGTRLIAVRDDGGGIPAEELELALAPHATSKITEPQDLEAIATMGFRGEALASIASVARVRITSRPPEAESAAVVAAASGRLEPLRPCAGPPGTLVEVRDLFFNVPARRKFLRGETAESTRVAEQVRLLALAHPTVGVRLEVDGRVRLDLPADQDAHARIRDVLGRDLAPHLLPLEHDEAGVRVRGMIGTPDLARPTARAIRLLLNGRPIADRTVVHAVREGYRGLIEPGRSPTVVLWLQVDPRRVDVNVHPQKTEVRFRDQAAVHAAVRHAIREALRRADIVPAVDLSRAGGGDEAGGAGSFRGAVETMLHRGAWGAGRPPAPAPGGGGGSGLRVGPAAGFGGGPPRPAAPSPVVLSRLRSALEAESVDDATRERLMDRLAGPLAESDTPPVEPSELPAEPSFAGIRPVIEVMQVHGSFLVAQDERGLLIVDQHALHERIMFEELRERLAEGSLESQRQLMPIVLEVPEGHLEHLPALEPLLGRLGFELAPLGPTAIGVHAVPTLLVQRRVDIPGFLEDLLRRTEEDGSPPDGEAALSEVLDMMACKAAVKAGEKLSAADMAELMAARERFERSSNCPHGRPTTLRLSIEDLERQFGRR
ncbi:MAG: DNA mismatch repair endonuclease MutL [Planctomycetota bacterium]|jgi:DNA mismatch repair protein MutL